MSEHSIYTATSTVDDVIALITEHDTTLAESIRRGEQQTLTPRAHIVREPYYHTRQQVDAVTITWQYYSYYYERTRESSVTLYQIIHASRAGGDGDVTVDQWINTNPASDETVTATLHLATGDGFPRHLGTSFSI